MVNSFGTGTVSDEKLAAAVRHVFDCRPGALIRELDLLRPIYKQTAAYGHFGRTEPDFTWEQTPKVDALADAARSGNGIGKAHAKLAAKPRLASVR
jgi:S-adenosylmethionine synthetase